MLYIGILVYILILVYNYDFKRETSGFETHYKILLVIFILVAGLSYRLGIDLIRSEENFIDTKTGLISYKQLFEFYEFKNGTEPLWLVLMSFVKLFTKEYFILHLVVAACFNITVFWFFKKYSPAFFTSVFLYAILAFFHFNFGALRESMALVFILTGLPNLLTKKKKYVRYFLWIIPALLFHRFAFIAVLLPLVKFVKNSRVYIAIIIAIAFISATVISQNLGLYINLLLGEEISSELDYYLQGDAATLNVNGYISIFITTIIPFYWIISGGTKKNSVFMSWGLAYLLFLILSHTSIYLFSRVLDYLLFPTFVAMSETIETTVYHPLIIKSSLKSQRLMIIVLLFYLFVNIYNTSHSTLFRMYYPYSSVIEKSIDIERERFYDISLYH